MCVKADYRHVIFVYKLKSTRRILFPVMPDTKWQTKKRKKKESTHKFLWMPPCHFIVTAVFQNSATNAQSNLHASPADIIIILSDNNSVNSRAELLNMKPVSK